MVVVGGAPGVVGAVLGCVVGWVPGWVVADGVIVVGGLIVGEVDGRVTLGLVVPGDETVLDSDDVVERGTDVSAAGSGARVRSLAMRLFEHEGATARIPIDAMSPIVTTPLRR